MSTLYKRKDSPYIWWSLTYRGKRLRISTGMRQATLAKQVQLQWDMMIFKGDLSFTGNTHFPSNNVDAFMDEYLKLRARVSYNTETFSGVVVRKFKKYLDEIGIDSISDITTKVIDGFVDYLSSSGKTKRNHIKELKILFDKAVTDELLLKNPVLNVTKPRVVKRERHRLLDVNDLKIILADKGKYRLYFEFLYLTGLRAGDVACLRYSDIDFEKSLVKSLIRKSGRFHEFPLAKTLIEKLNKGISGPIFPSLYSESERKLNDNLAKPRKYMQLLLLNNNRKKATLHSFRVTFNNILRDLGLQMEDRQKLLAHSSSETTKIYTLPNVKQARKWIDKMPLYG
jgi:integrase